MDKTNKKEDTLIKLKELLTICNIKKIYYVDDENNLPVVNKEIIKGLLYKIFSSEKENEVYQSGIRMFEEDQPVEVLIQCVDKYWETTSKDVQDKILLTLSSISNSEKINLARPHSLKHQIPEEYLMFWSPYEWDTNKENLEKDLNGNEKVLVLFDEDLKYAKNYELTRGQDLIAAVKKSGNKNFICTLLTHKIPAPKDELGFRIDVLKKNEDLTEEDFFPLAKSRIDDPAVFADGLKKALLNKHIVKIKKQSIAIIEAGYREAITKINNFDIYDFEEIILQSSLNEGIWEPETLIRISNITFENELKRKMVESSYVKNVNKEIKYIHEFSNIKFNITDNIRPYTDKYNLRNTESYETGNIINNLRKPIENGDIFDIDNKYYVLVAQPCDLMIRTRGGKRNTQIATLLKITTVPYDEDKIIKLIQPGNKYALYYFVKEKTDVGIVSFKNYLMVDMNLLDLCVFNASGECKTINDLKNYDLDYLCMGWEKRFKVINAKINSLKMKLNVVNNLSIMPHLHKIINRKYYPRIVIYASELNPHGVNVENGIYDFHVKRISKVKEPTSNYLLEIYTQYLSRKAYQHDYAKRND